MIKCVAIDDEPLALRQIKSYIAHTPDLELVASFGSALDARDFLAEEPVPLLFVDISMPGLSGLDFVRELNPRPMVVFTTAHSEYAIEGFRLSAVDYLLKPFSLSDFQRSVEKVKSLYELYLHAQQAAERSESEALPEGPEYLTIKADYKTSLIRIADIVYIESEGEYVRLHLNDGSSVMTLFRLKNMQTALPEEHFMRIHRSYIVNLRCITGYAKGRVFLSDEEYIPIGDNYRAAFQRYVDEKFGA